MGSVNDLKDSERARYGACARCGKPQVLSHWCVDEDDEHEAVRVECRRHGPVREQTGARAARGAS